MKTNYLLSALLLLGSMFLMGCFEEIAGPFDGPSQVEFEQVNGRYSLAVTDGAGLIELQTNLIGPHRDVDTPFTFITTEDGTTGQEGVHFAFPDGLQFTIPANSSFGAVRINVLASGLATGETRTIALVLENSTDGAVLAAENLKHFTLTVSGP